MTRQQLAAIRIAFGAYLVVHLLLLLPYTEELFAGASPQNGWPLFAVEGWRAAYVLIVVMIAAAVALCLGITRSIMAIFLWWGWASLFARNALIENPSTGYVGWLLLALAIVPAGESLSWPPARREEGWNVPPSLIVGAWLVLAAGNGASGLHKLLGSPSWIDGSALEHSLTLPAFGRVWWGQQAMLALPAPLLQAGTWSILAFEIGFAFLCLSPPTRRLAWWGGVAMHLLILVFLDMADLTVPMLIFYAFVYESVPSSSREA